MGMTLIGVGQAIGVLVAVAGPCLLALYVLFMLARNEWTIEEREYVKDAKRARRRSRREAMKLQRKAMQWGTAIDTAVRDARKGEMR